MNRKFWSKILIKNLSHEKCLELMAKNPGMIFATREEWDGIHFVGNYESYGILLKDGRIISDPDEVYNADSNDWMIVEATKEAINLLIEDGILSEVLK